MGEALKEFAHDPYFAPMLYYVTTLFGAIAMYVFALNKGFEGAVPFLKRVFPDRSQVFYDRMDFFVTSVAGSIVGTICFSPQSTLQALAAGFGWVGAMNVLMTPQGHQPGLGKIQPKIGVSPGAAKTPKIQEQAGK